MDLILLNIVPFSLISFHPLTSSKPICRLIIISLLFYPLEVKGGDFVDHGGASVPFMTSLCRE